MMIWAPLALMAAGDVPAQRVTSVVRADPRTGRLVRSIVVAPKTVTPKPVAPRVVSPVAPESAPAPSAGGIDGAVERIAARNSLPPQLIHSVIKVESNYNPYAVSPKGALGMMQLIPATARRFGVSDVFNPEQNIEGGARYLRYLLDLFHDNIGLALAAYNAGENAVAKFGTVPPYAETRNYLQLVASQLKKETARQMQKAKDKAPKPVENAPGGPNHIQQILEPDGTVRYVTR